MSAFTLGELAYCPFRDNAHRGASPREAGVCEGPDCMLWEWDVVNASGHCGAVGKASVNVGTIDSINSVANVGSVDAIDATVPITVGVPA